MSKKAICIRGITFKRYDMVFLQMTSTNKVFGEKKTGPYPLGLKVKVVARDDVQSYKKDGEEKEVLTCAVSDGEEVLKVLCYDKYQVL